MTTRRDEERVKKRCDSFWIAETKKQTTSHTHMSRMGGGVTCVCTTVTIVRKKERKKEGRRDILSIILRINAIINWISLLSLFLSLSLIYI